MRRVKVVVIKGLPGVKDNTKGTLIIGEGSMHFAHEAVKSDLATHSIDDVVTGDDSQRVIRGTVGTLSWFAPYGAGRFLSLFRSKLDTVTIKYRDTDGGLHGAIFTMPVGQAEVIKKDLLAQGARTTVTEADTKAACIHTGREGETMRELRIISRAVACLIAMLLCGFGVVAQESGKAGENQGIGDSSGYDSFRRDQSFRLNFRCRCMRI